MTTHTLIRAIRDHGPADPMQTFMLYTLASFADEEGVCWPSVATLVKASHLCKRSVIDRLAQLEGLGWIAVSESATDRRRSVYQIVLPKLVHEDAPNPASLVRVDAPDNSSLVHPDAPNSDDDRGNRCTDEHRKVHLGAQIGASASTPIRKEEIRKRSRIDQHTDSQSSSGRFVLSKKNNSAKNRAALDDPLFEGCREAILRYLGGHLPIEPGWSTADARELQKLLQSSPSLDLASFRRCLQHRNESECNHCEPPQMFIPKLPRYLSGPLDRYGRPRGSSSTSGTISAAEAIREMYGDDAPT